MNSTHERPPQYRQLPKPSVSILFIFFLHSYLNSLNIGITGMSLPYCEYCAWRLQGHMLPAFLLCLQSFGVMTLVQWVTYLCASPTVFCIWMLLCATIFILILRTETEPLLVAWQGKGIGSTILGYEAADRELIQVSAEGDRDAGRINRSTISLSLE